ncbi:MAG: hypothetical protein WCO94_16975 [Verrucomicrobiota bacterium]
MSPFVATTFICKRPSLAFFSLLILSVSAYCGGEGWPEGYSVAEDSISPDGRFGVLLPSREAVGDAEEDTIKNFLVDLPSYRKIAAIRGAHYFPGENHRDLHVTWAKDSDWVVVTYEERYGFENITLVSTRGRDFSQTDLGRHIQKALNAAISRQTGSPESSGYGSAYFRAGSGREILVRATALTDPKGLSEEGQLYAMFLGTFNPATGKWIRSEAGKIDSLDDMTTAFSGGFNEGMVFANEENRLSWHDDRLNEVYRALRVLLPPDRFARVKKDQIAWLKRLEATGSDKQKADLIAARIRELRELAW